MYFLSGAFCFVVHIKMKLKTKVKFNKKMKIFFLVFLMFV